MTHLWVRSEQRGDEKRVGLTPDGARALISRGFRVTIEHSPLRILPVDGYADAGCDIAPQNSWRDAPRDAFVFGLKELPDDNTPLVHNHIMFGHAYKGQSAGQTLLRRFRAGGGTLFDLEYLVDDTGRRVAAFGYWAGFAGAAVALTCWAAQQRGAHAGPVSDFARSDDMLAHLRADLGDASRPDALIIGALGRVGTGAADLCAALDVKTTKWDIDETAHGGPFPEILAHAMLLNCILAGPGTPVFVPQSARTARRALRVIGDIACDPDSAFNPIPVYDRTTTWAAPCLRVHDDPPLDITAIDNLPSLLPLESSKDYAAQLLPTLLSLDTPDAGVWLRARNTFRHHVELS